MIVPLRLTARAAATFATIVIAVTTASMIAPTNAQAASEDIKAELPPVPEFFHQPLAYTHEITPGFGFRHAFYTDTREHLIRGLDHAGITYRYGINDDVAIGAQVSYSSFTTFGPDKAKGFEPVQLTADLRAGLLRYGLQLSNALEPAEVHTYEGNRSLGDPLEHYGAGGFRVTPYIGFQKGIVGAKLKGDVITNATSTNLGSIDGARQLEATVFIESTYNNDTIGAAIQYDVFESQNATGSPSFGQHGLLGTRLWAGMPYDKIVFLPTITWQAKVGGDFGESTDIHLTFAARFAL